MTTIRSSGIVRDITSMREQIDRLQRQFSSGKKADTYAGLGADRQLSLSSRTKLSEVKGFEQTITDVTVRIDVVQSTLSRFDGIAREQRAANLEPKLNHVNGLQTAAQLSAENRMDEVISLLNQNINGRFGFSGRASDVEPVASRAEILNGKAPQIGLVDLTAERRRADLGADGRGRMATARVTTNVTLTDIAGPFGMKIAGITSSLSGNTATDTGAPAPRTVAFDFTGQPGAGQTARISLTLPDGSTQAINLTSMSGPTSAPGRFEIGVDPTATAANFQAALTAEVERISRTSLVSASAMAAGNDFFDNPPRRIATPSAPETATAFEAVNSNSVVVWYKGERGSDDPRATASARIDRNVTIGYGVRADEKGIRDLISGLATMAATRFDPISATDRVAYSEMADKTRVAMNADNGGGVTSIQTTIALAQASIKSAKERHDGEKQVLSNLLDEAEGISNEEVATQLLALQTRLQASYQTTAMISKLSLVNYL